MLIDSARGLLKNLTMDLLNKEHISGLLKHDWKFLLKLLLSGFFTALGFYELFGMEHIEFAFVTFVFVPLAGLFFTFLKLEANTSVLRVVAITMAALAVGFMSHSFFLAIASFLMLEGSTHKESLVRFDDFKWMRIVRTEDSQDDVSDMISCHTLFMKLPEEERMNLSKKCRVTELSEGAALIKQGEFNYFLYLIGKGAVDVVVDGQKVASLREGDVVGEISASGLSLPVADVVANSDVLAFAFPIDAVNEAAIAYPEFADQMREIGMRRVK